MVEPTRLLYQEDSYLRKFKARVLSVEGDLVVLDQTAFHPRPHGGLDTDTGVLRASSGEARVLEASMRDGIVYHRISDPGFFKPGMEVEGEIDWDRRYNMMKLHTASHVLASILYEKYGALVTGGHITPEYARDDFGLEDSDWKEKVAQAIEETNRVLSRCIEVKVYWLTREEALKLPGLSKLAKGLPEGIDNVRIVEIPGVDLQADGGPHVRNTCEIGGIKATRFESKGRKRRRVYYTLAEADG